MCVKLAHFNIYAGHILNQMRLSDRGSSLYSMHDIVYT